jgi:hypothetical protein
VPLYAAPAVVEDWQSHDVFASLERAVSAAVSLQNDACQLLDQVGRVGSKISAPWTDPNSFTAGHGATLPLPLFLSAE